MIHYVIGRPTGPLPWQWEYRFRTVDSAAQVSVPAGWQRVG